MKVDSLMSSDGVNCNLGKGNRHLEQPLACELFEKQFDSKRGAPLEQREVMTELIWDGKYKDGKKVSPVRIALPLRRETRAVCDEENGNITIYKMRR